MSCTASKHTKNMNDGTNHLNSKGRRQELNKDLESIFDLDLNHLLDYLFLNIFFLVETIQ